MSKENTEIESSQKKAIRPPPSQPITRFILIHGDKGGVGKSMLSCVLADQLMSAKVPVAVIDADTRNPDVARMFSGSDCPNIRLNLRASDGWMDIIDFVHSYPGHTFILSMPAGIGESMQHEFADFVKFLRSFESKSKDKIKVELVMWWVLNLFPDSVNLLKEALDTHHNQFDQVVVVRNNIFGQPDDFIFWNDSPLKTEVEAKGGVTVDLPPLHLRVMKKLFDPSKIIPFSTAIQPDMSDIIGLQPSERFKLESWFNDHVTDGLGSALKRLKPVN